MNPITRIARWWLKLDSKCAQCKETFHHAPVTHAGARFCSEEHAAQHQADLAW